jgi:recombination protein RecT
MNDAAKKPSTQVPAIIEFKRTLADMIERKDLALPSSVSPDAFRNAAIVAVQDNPLILTCKPDTVFRALRRLAAAGLVPDGREAALVPFKMKIDDNYVQVCQAMPMVFGLIKTARNSGEITDIRAHIVYQKEVDEGRFTYVIGDREALTHEPILFGEKGAPVAAYAIAMLKDGSIIREFMAAEDIDRVRRSGASQLNFVKGERPKVSDTPKGTWADWPSEMWKKSVIRRLCKRLPISAEDMRRIMEDEDNLRDAIRDVTPREPTGFVKVALSARAPAAPRESAQDARKSDEPPEDAQIAEPHWTARCDDPNGIPMSRAWDRGVSDATDGKAESDCPYDEGQDGWDWLAAYRGVRKARGSGE